MSLFPMGGQGKTCPDCGCGMSESECPECGYGSEEEEDGEEMEGASIQELMDLKDDLQRVMEKVNRLIVKIGD